MASSERVCHQFVVVAERGAVPQVSAGRRRALRMIRSFTSPLLPDDYLELVNPLWSTRELRGRIERIERETPEAVTVLIKPGWDNAVGAAQQAVLALEPRILGHDVRVVDELVVEVLQAVRLAQVVWIVGGVFAGRLHIGSRSQRYAAVIDDGIVTWLGVEPGPGLSASSAEEVLAVL